MPENSNWEKKFLERDFGDGYTQKKSHTKKTLRTTKQGANSYNVFINEYSLIRNSNSNQSIESQTNTFSTFSGNSSNGRVYLQDTTPTEVAVRYRTSQPEQQVRDSTSSGSGTLSDSQHTTPTEVAVSYSTNQPILADIKKSAIRKSVRRVSDQKVPKNCTTISSALSTEESSRVTEHTPSEKTLKEKWLSLINEKCPRKDKIYSIKNENGEIIQESIKDYYLNANLDIRKETIRNLKDKVKYATCPVTYFPNITITKEDKDVLKEINHDLTSEIQRNEKILAREEKRIEKFEKSKSSAPKSIFTQLLELLHLSNSHTR